MKKIYLFLILMASGYLTQAQVKIGDNPTTVGTSSALELESTNKALVITRVANTAAITNPVNGMVIYDISSKCIKAYENGAWTNCLSNGSNIEPSTNGTAVVSSYTCSTSSAGTLSAGVQVSGVTQTITANVTQLGTYSLNAFANGVVFSGSGTFTSLGSQTIVLSAIGTPVAVGSNSFTLNTIPNCSFSRTTQGNPSSGGTAIVSAYTCTTASAGTLTAGTAVSGVTQTITATVTTAGTYNITATANGVIFTGTGTFAGTGAQDVVLTATGTPTTPGSNSFTLSTTPNCSFTRPVNSPTSGGTAVVSAYNCSGTSVGTMTAGTAVSGVTQTITATVTTAGTYSISIPAVNGISWSGSGTFAGTGSQTITLTASGTPTTAGTSTFALPITPTCSFTRSVSESFASALCTIGTGTFPSVQNIGGNTVTINKITSTDLGSNPSGGSVCSTTVTATSLGFGSSTSNNTATLQFSIPLKNVQFVLYGANELNEGVSVSASLAGVSVPVQLIAFGGTCTSAYTMKQVGDVGYGVATNSSGPNVAFNIGSSGPYDTIIITRVASVPTGDFPLSFFFCNATAVPNSTSGGSAVVSAYNCSGTAVGTLTVGTAASGVTQTITATVTTAGGYNISVPATNGVSWSGSGTFAGTGAQTITLTASGTPTTAGTSTFALSGTPTCSFTRSVGEAFTRTICATSTSNTFPQNAVVGGNTVTVTRTGTFNSSTNTTSICGISITGTSINLNGSQSSTYTFTIPLQNLQFWGWGNQTSGEGYSVTATLAGVNVPVQLVPFGGTCTSNFIATQSGNAGVAQLSANNASELGAMFNISSAGPYDQVVITRLNVSTSNDHGLVYCNATAVPNATTGGSAIVSSYTCSTASAGNLYLGSAASGVTQTITANVTTAGAYNITTNASNGVTFSGSGTFSGTGAQNVVLTASGTPTSLGTPSFTLATTPNCSFTRTITNHPSTNGSAVVSTYNCSTASAGTLTVGKVATGVTQTITATVTTVGTYNISIAAVNGITWTASGTFAGTGSQTITLTASGTPTAEGIFSHTINTTPSCSFSRFVNGDGTTSAKASISCKQIKTDFPSSSDGVYWLDIDGTGAPYNPTQAYCDMTTDGGGWTLIKNYNHGAATTPALNDARATFPLIVNLNAVAAGEASDASAWGGMPQNAINILNTSGFIAEGRNTTGRVLAKKFNQNYTFASSITDTASYGNPVTGLDTTANAKVWFSYGTANCNDPKFALDFIWCNPTYKIWSIKQYTPGTCCGSPGGEVNEGGVFRLWVK